MTEGGAVADSAVVAQPQPSWALGHTLQRLRGQIDLLEAEFATTLAAFCSQRLFEREGFPDAVSWLKVRCRMSPGAAAERVLVADQLPRLPQAERALARGEIGYQSAAIIARSASQVMPQDAPKVEEMTLAVAGEVDPGRLRDVARAVVAQVDHEAIVRDSTRAYTRRRLSLSLDRDGCTVVDGLLDPEAGARLRTALDRIMGPRSASDERTPQQRRADALSELAGAREGAAPRLRPSTQVRPLLTVVAPLSALLGESGVPAIMQGSIPISRAALRRLACDCAVSAVVTDETQNPVFAGSQTRTFGRSVRRALTARDRGCVFPGCGRPPEWCDGHHLVHRADGGPNTVANGCLLCAFHHRCVHEGGWAIARAPGGTWRVTAPFARGPGEAS